jgi:hypothetical protein
LSPAQLSLIESGKVLLATVFEPQEHQHHLANVFPVQIVPQDQKGLPKGEQMVLDRIDHLEFEAVRHFDWKISGEALLHQLERFRTLFGPDIENNPVGGTLAEPAKVLSFARNLMLCATEQSAASYIGQDRESARACYIVSDDFATAENKESAEILIPEPTFETPFFLLASIAMARAKLAIERHGGLWGTK